MDHSCALDAFVPFVDEVYECIISLPVTQTMLNGQQVGLHVKTARKTEIKEANHSRSCPA